MSTALCETNRITHHNLDLLRTMRVFIITFGLMFVTPDEPIQYCFVLQAYYLRFRK